MKNEMVQTLGNDQNSLCFYSILIVIFLCLFGFTNLHAQDIIIKKDGSEIEAKVLEVKSSNITYKRFEMLDGPTYEIDKSEIFIIKYSSGQKDVFNEIKIAQEEKVNPLKSPNNKGASKRNAIGVNPIMLLFEFDSKLGYVEYEKLIGKRMSIGGRILRTEKYAWPYQESTTGAGVFVRKYFNNGSGLKGFYIGSSLDVLAVDWSDSWRESEWNSSSGYFEYHTKYEYGSGMVVAVTSQFGYKFNIGKSFYIEPSASLGFYNSFTSSSRESYSELGIIAAPALTFGCKF